MANIIDIHTKEPCDPEQPQYVKWANDDIQTLLKWLHRIRLLEIEVRKLREKHWWQIWK